MDPSFWHDRWENQDIGFHQADIHALLPAYWPRLELASDAPVFVPLCGKSLDMVWLAQQGHRVIGAELSQRAIDDFFAERGLAPTTRASGSFTVKSAGPYELWCGDFFDLPREAVAGVAGVYDRAALIALPPCAAAAVCRHVGRAVAGASAHPADHPRIRTDANVRAAVFRAGRSGARAVRRQVIDWTSSSAAMCSTAIRTSSSAG